MRSRLWLITLLLIAIAEPSAGQTGKIREMRSMATEHMIEGEGDASLLDYAHKHLAADYRDSFADEAALLDHLRNIRDAVAPLGGVGLMIDGAGVVRLHISNRAKKSVVAVRLEKDDPYAIVDITLESSEARAAGPSVSWDTLGDTMLEAEQKGFCGSILAVRDGNVVLDRGYGHADPKRQHKVSPTTLFAIGSTPIDFTHGAILELEESGKLSLSDPITKFFDDVPTDKQSITLEHLRTGQSGLLDFPGLPEVDANLDLSWIGRDEFMRRVLSAPLLFEPGTSEKHSHCAWGVLTAVVELVSGQPYEQYLRETFFEPAGMTRTGNYPLSKSFPDSEVAVGLGGNQWGEVNSPQHWGETSWLVMGSGGMVSTPRDLRRWRDFMKSGKVLGPAAQKKYGVEGVFAAEGGNDRGFINTIGAQGDDLVIMCSNSHTGMADFAAQLGEALTEMVLDEP